jgi:hypothetical protein
MKFGCYEPEEGKCARQGFNASILDVICQQFNPASKFFVLQSVILGHLELYKCIKYNLFSE